MKPFELLPPAVLMLGLPAFVGIACERAMKDTVKHAGSTDLQIATTSLTGTLCRGYSQDCADNLLRNLLYATPGVEGAGLAPVPRPAAPL